MGTASERTASDVTRARGGARAGRALLGTGLVAALLLGACSGNPAREAELPPQGNATIVESPVPATPPAGAVVATGAALPQAAWAPGAQVLVAVVDGTPRLRLLDVHDGTAATVAEVDLPADAGAPGYISVRDRRVVVPQNGRITIVDLDGERGAVRARARTVERGGEWISSVIGEDGRMYVGSASGDVAVLGANGDVDERFGSLARIDEMAATGTTVVAFNRSESRLAIVDTDGDRIAPILRAGHGSTRAAAGPDGTFVVADTAGSQLLLYRARDFLLHQTSPAVPAGGALVWDAGRNLVWMTSTSENLVVGYSISAGMAIEKVRIPTVRQPNSVTVRPGGPVLVASATGDGLQIIDDAVIAAHPTERDPHLVSTSPSEAPGTETSSPRPSGSN